jgi:hypothetical protein
MQLGLVYSGCCARYVSGLRHRANKIIGSVERGDECLN